MNRKPWDHHCPFPSWELWSNDYSWGMRELDTRKIREGASVEEAGSGTAHHIDMGCEVQNSKSQDAQFIGHWLKAYAILVSVPELLHDYRKLIDPGKDSDELSRMLKECDDRPWGSTRNSRVAILIRHHLDLLKELDLLAEKVNRLHKIMAPHQADLEES